MNNKPNPPGKNPPAFTDQIRTKAERKLRARRHDTAGIWFGLGMMGLIGWSVSVPTLLGAALGLWLDKRYPGDLSWTLALLAAGLLVGCMNAWRWIAKENQAMRDEQKDDHE